MTLTPTPVEAPGWAPRLDFDHHVPGFAKAMGQLDQAATRELDRGDISPSLRELLRVRASQLNGCAYCIDMHTKDARAGGETEQRLYALPAWTESTFFTGAERAALGFCEAVTLTAATHVPDEAYKALALHFSPQQVAAVLALLVTVNAWNRIGVATRAWTPGSYQP